MKNIVIFDEYNETELKPSQLLQKYIRLTEKDVSGLLIKNKKLKKVSCPACLSSKILSSFTKMGLKYRECASCGTVYVSPRPDDESLFRYYTQSSARRFWHDEISASTGARRKEKIIKPRLDWIVDSVQEFLPGARNIADIHTTQTGYAEEMKQCGIFSKKFIVNPFLPLNRSGFGSGVQPVSSREWELELKNQIDAVSLFEVLDRTANVEQLVGKIKTALKENGLLFLTAILISGFDMQILWKEASSLYPPDRLNLFTVEGLQILFKRHGFECLEFSTPGILDVTRVSKAIEAQRGKFCRFAEYLVKNRDANLRHAFQVFLQKELLSSYGRILLRKGG